MISPHSFDLSMIVSVLIAMTSAVNFGDDRDEAEAELRSAEALTIRYKISGNEKTVTVSDPEEVKDLTSTIDVTDVEKGSQVGMDEPPLIVEFNLTDEKVIKAIFVHPDEIDRDSWGMILLDKKFYKKISEIISKKEGKEVDVLGEGDGG